MWFPLQVIQFTVKHEQNIDCGGGYVKLFPCDLDQTQMNGDSPYGIMFGPDICGPGTKKVHVIFNYKGKNHLVKKDIRCKDDVFTHLYTLVVKPDQTYEVLIDNEKVESGSLEEDWDFLPPKKIKDPEAKKPEDWDDREKIDDPSDTKPEDWDKPEYIADPEAKKPEDWDDEMDGEWEPPQITNPEYKGEWKPKKIDNPAYKGKWVHPEIDNPEYQADEKIYLQKELCHVGLDLWQVKSGTIFDNFLITDDPEMAKAFGEETWGSLKDAEKKMKDEQDEEQKKKDEEEAKRMEEELEKNKTPEDDEASLTLLGDFSRILFMEDLIGSHEVMKRTGRFVQNGSFISRFFAFRLAKRMTRSPKKKRKSKRRRRNTMNFKRSPFIYS